MIIFVIMIVMILHDLCCPIDAGALGVAGLLVSGLLRQVLQVVRVAAGLSHFYSDFKTRSVVMKRIAPSNEDLFIGLCHKLSKAPRPSCCSGCLDMQENSVFSGRNLKMLEGDRNKKLQECYR